MSLQGTLETIPLSDVLSLLAATSKSGELKVTGPRGEGRLWIDGGKVVQADVPRAATPVDAVFELLRLSSGTFAFEAGTAAPSPGEPRAVDALLSEAKGRLDVWKSIEAVVPSTRCLVGLTPELGSDSVTVTRGQWRQLVSVAGGGDVHGVMERLGLGEFEACRTVKELVDAGLARVAPAPTPREPERPAPPAPTPPPRSAAGGRPTASRPPEAAPGTPDRRAPSEAAPGTPERAPSEAASPAPVGSRTQSAAPSPARTPAAASPAPAARTAVATGRAPAGPPTPARAEPGRSPTPVPSREEAEELVHQLASLSQAAGGGGEHPGGEGPDAGKASPSRAAKPAGTPADPSDEEPINRGMLLKFLSSVRP